MLNSTVKPIAAPIVLIAVLLAGCSITKPTFDTLLLHKSDTQTLVVRNGLARAVELIPGDDGNSSIRVPAGQTTDIQFVVFTTMNLEAPDSRFWYSAEEGTEENLVEENSGLEYLSTEGDVTLTVKLTDVEFRKYLLLFGDCWFETSAPQHSHDLTITDNEEEDFREVEFCPD